MSNNSPFVKLPHGFQRKHYYVLEKYLAGQQLSRSQWWMVLQAFDLLRNATIQQNNEQYTFHSFYRSWVDKVYANPFLKELSTSVDPEQDGCCFMLPTNVR